MSVTSSEAYKEHIEYTFNAFSRVVIRYAAINAWRNRNKRRQREISLEYLTEEKFYPFCTSDTGIYPYIVPVGAAHQLVSQSVEYFALDIPQRLIDAGRSAHQHAAAAIEAGPIDRIP